MRRRLSTPVVMMGPAVLFTVLLVGFPFVYTIWLSFHNWFMGSRTPSRFIGFSNYVTMVHDPLFWQSLAITLEISIAALIIELVLGTYIALLINRSGRIVKVVRAVLLFPSVIPSVAAGMVWLVLFNPSLGFVNYVLHLVGLPSGLWLDSPHTVVGTLVFIDVWQWTPFITLIILGGLQALPMEPFEAAMIDGASPWQQLIHLTLPLLRPVIWVALMLRSVDVIRIFDTIYVMTQGGPGTSSTSLNIYAYQQSFQYFHMGYASTLMLMLLIVVVVVNLGLRRFRQRGV